MKNHVGLAACVLLLLGACAALVLNRDASALRRARKRKSPGTSRTRRSTCRAGGRSFLPPSIRRLSGEFSIVIELPGDAKFILSGKKLNRIMRIVVAQMNESRRIFKD